MKIGIGTIEVIFKEDAVKNTKELRLTMVSSAKLVGNSLIISGYDSAIINMDTVAYINVDNVTIE